MPRGVRKREGENLTDSAIEEVINKLNATDPITKKVACEILNISYNTTRLNKIIEEYLERREHAKVMRAKMRTKPVDKSDASYIVSSYLSGSSLVDISDKTFRSTGVIKRVLTKYNVPIRNTSSDYFNPVDIESSAMADDYVPGDLVYSAKYDCPATILKVKDTERYGMIYKLRLHALSRDGWQEWYELADLRRVQKELEVKIEEMDSDEIKMLIYEGLKNAKKQQDKRK